MTPDRIATEFIELCARDRETTERLQAFQFVPDADGLEGDELLDCLVRIRAAIGDVRPGGSYASVQHKLRMLSDRIAELQSAGCFSETAPTFKLKDFSRCVQETKPNRWGEVFCWAAADDLSKFRAGQRLLALLAARGVELPTISGRPIVHFPNNVPRTERIFDRVGSRGYYDHMSGDADAVCAADEIVALTLSARERQDRDEASRALTNVSS